MNEAYNKLRDELAAGRIPCIDKEIARTVTRSAKNLALNAHIASGNHKLPVDTAIFNMGPAETCPSEALGLCQAINAAGKNICYAKKAEIQYPQVLPYRRAQAKYWKETDGVDIALQLVLTNALKRRPYRALRINESGDFYGQEDIEKAETVAHILSLYGVKAYVYTARKDLDFSNVKALVVNGSGFTAAGVPNEFKYIESREDRPKTHRLCPGDCRICDRCLNHGKLTACIKH